MDKRTVTAIIVISVLAIAFIGTANTGFFPLAGRQNEDISIGSILILTGEGSTWGNAAKNGIDMAIEKINSGGGINGKKLVADHQDSQEEPAKAISAFNELVSFKGTNIIIGTTWSPSGLALKELAHSNKVLMISPSLGVPEFNESSKYLFNTWPHDFMLSQNLADHVYEKGHRKVAIIGAQQVWVKDQTNAFRERFEELGGKVEILVEPNPKDLSVNTDALKVKNSEEIDAIVYTIGGGFAMGPMFAKRFRELGVELPEYTITMDAKTIAAADGAFDGLEMLTFLTPSEEFKKEYEEKYGISAEIGAASAYDAVMLIAKAIEETGSTDTTVLQEYLNKVKEYKGASGSLVADGKGGFVKEQALKKVVGVEIIDA